MQKLQGYASGNKTVVNSLSGTTQTVLGTYPLCTITVYLAGTVTIASIYSDNLAVPTVKANPFTASADGSWFFYAVGGRYDVRFSGTGITVPFTLSDFYLHSDWDVVNVRDYGVLGGGVVNEAVALQAAVDAAKTISGGVVYVPPNMKIRITANVDFSGTTILGANRDTSIIFVDFAGKGLKATGAIQSSVKNISIWGVTAFAWATVPLAGKIGVSIETTHQHRIENCDFFALDTGVKISGGGYYGNTIFNRFRVVNTSFHLLSDGTGPPNEQRFMHNQLQIGAAAAPGTGTIAIRLEGIPASPLDGVKIWDNGIENVDTAYYMARTNYCQFIGNRYELVTDKFQYATSAAVDNVRNMEITGGGSYPGLGFGIPITNMSTPGAGLIRGELTMDALTVNYTDDTWRGTVMPSDDFAGLPDGWTVLRVPNGKGWIFLDGSDEYLRLEKGRITIPASANNLIGVASLIGNANSPIANTKVTADTKVFICPINAAAGTLQAGANAVYHNPANNVAGVSFTLTTAGGGAAVGTEQFSYIMFN